MGHCNPYNFVEKIHEVVYSLAPIICSSFVEGRPARLSLKMQIQKKANTQVCPYGISFARHRELDPQSPE